MCRIPGLIVVLFRSDQATVAEVLVLRHENVVLRRQAGRVRYEPADRAWFAAVAPSTVHRLEDPARCWPRPGTAPPGPQLGAVPARPGRWDPRRRFPARRH